MRTLHDGACLPRASDNISLLCFVPACVTGWNTSPVGLLLSYVGAQVTRSPGSYCSALHAVHTRSRAAGGPGWSHGDSPSPPDRGPGSRLIAQLRWVRGYVHTRVLSLFYFNVNYKSNWIEVVSMTGLFIGRTTELRYVGNILHDGCERWLSISGLDQIVSFLNGVWWVLQSAAWADRAVFKVGSVLGWGEDLTSAEFQFHKIWQRFLGKHQKHEQLFSTKVGALTVKFGSQFQLQPLFSVQNADLCLHKRCFYCGGVRLEAVVFCCGHPQNARACLQDCCWALIGPLQLSGWWV